MAYWQNLERFRSVVFELHRSEIYDKNQDGDRPTGVSRDLVTYAGGSNHNERWNTCGRPGRGGATVLQCINIIRQTSKARTKIWKKVHAKASMWFHSFNPLCYILGTSWSSCYQYWYSFDVLANAKPKQGFPRNWSLLWAQRLQNVAAAKCNVNVNIFMWLIRCRWWRLKEETTGDGVPCSTQAHWH